MAVMGLDDILIELGLRIKHSSGAKPLTCEGWRELCEDDKIKITPDIIAQAFSIRVEDPGGCWPGSYLVEEYLDMSWYEACKLDSEFLSWFFRFARAVWYEDRRAMRSEYNRILWSVGRMYERQYGEGTW